MLLQLVVDIKGGLNPFPGFLRQTPLHQPSLASQSGRDFYLTNPRRAERSICPRICGGHRFAIGDADGNFDFVVRHPTLFEVAEHSGSPYERTPSRSYKRIEIS